MKQSNWSRPVLGLVVALAALTAVSCNVASKSRKTQERPVTPPDEVSLRADRTQFDEARKDIPEEIKRENDELAFIRNLMTQGDEEPQKIRDRFNKALRDRREKNDRNLRKEREDFTKDERKTRDEVLKRLKDERAAFMKRKATSEESREFFKNQEDKRNAYFGDEREKRNAFEAKQREARATFEDYAREKTNQFNQEIREYTTNYYERKKAEALKKRTEEKSGALNKGLSHPATGTSPSAGAVNGHDPLLEEFKSIPKTPSTHLGPSDQ